MTGHNANLIPVLSSHILAVGHDPIADALIVEFVDGSIVAYHGAPTHIAQQIASASSPGAALHALVKSQKYRHVYLRSPLPMPKRR